MRRLLNLKGIISKRNTYKGPDVVQIDLTDKCNSNCIACWIHSPLVVGDADLTFPELDYALLKGFIDELKLAGTKELIFSGGGEPFVYPRIWQILEHAQAAGLGLRINTNFTLVTEEDIGRLAAMKNLLSLTASVWSGDEDSYCRLHNRKPGEFRRVKESLKLLNAVKNRRLETRIYALVTGLNYRDMGATVDFAGETGCDTIEFGVIDVMPKTTDRFLLDSCQVVGVKNDFLKLTQRLKNKKPKLANKELFLSRISSPGAVKGEYDSRLAQVPCYAGWLFLRLRANGDFNSCLKSHRLPLGNIYKDSFESVWNGSRQKEFRQNGVSLPRNREYYESIGNYPGSIGCLRICDNALVNEHLHRRMRFLLPVLWKHAEN